MIKKTLVALWLFLFIVFAYGLNADENLPDYTAFITGASHIDLEWKWRLDEAVDVSMRTFVAVLDIMDDCDDYPGGNPVYYSQSNALLYQMMEERYPEVFARIQKRVRDGLWEIVGGMWTELDANLPSGESFIRQLFYGKRYFYDRFGVDVNIGWLPDSFGYNWNLPQFFAGSGIDYFFYFKTNWNDTHKPTIHNFWWEAPDGSRVLAHLSWGHYNNQLFSWRLKGLLNYVQEHVPDQPGFLYPIGMGDHGGGIGRRNIGVAMWLAQKDWPIHFGPASDFFEALDKDKIEDVIADELYFEMHRGSYTSRAKHKQEVRAIEFGLLGAEAVNARASLGDAEYPQDEIESIWKTVMLDQFHDTMAGTCFDPVYTLDVAERHDKAFAELDRIQTEGSLRMTGASFAGKDFSGEGWFVVFNPLGFLVSAPLFVEVENADKLAVFDPKGEAIDCQMDESGQGLWMIAKDVPGFGWRAYSLKNGEPGNIAPYTAKKSYLENEKITLAIDSGSGLVTSLTSKATGERNLIAPESAGNLLEIYYDYPKPFDSWDIGFDKYKELPIERLIDAKSVDFIETGPVRSVVRVKRKSQYEDYEQDIIIYYDLPRVDFVTRVFGWGSTAHRFLKVAFPLNLVNESKTVTTEMPYGTISRILDGSVANFEFTGHKWADIAENFPGNDPGPAVALLSREKYGFDVANDGQGEGYSDGQCNVLRLSLLKSGTSPLYLVPQSGGPITDKGDFESHYALFPHPNDAEKDNLLKVGNEYYAPFVVRYLGNSEPKEAPEFLLVEPENALALWLKRPEVNPLEGEVLLRIVESKGEKTAVTIQLANDLFSSAQFVNFLETPVERELRMVDDSTLEFDINSYEVVSLRMVLHSDAKDTSDDDSVDDDSDEPSFDDGRGCGC